jgi:threonine/homoserine/homoserine lactone efflux protein
VPSTETLWLFAVASAGLVLVPGPAVLYIVTRGIVHGRRGGLISVLGVEAGNVLQVIAATVGLAAVIASSATAFTVVKYAGAGYLVYLGIRALRSRDIAAPAAAGSGDSPRRLFAEGFVVGALNPKLALFLLAFLPQFIDPAAGPAWSQTLALGLIFNVIATIGDILFALAAGTAGVRLRRFLRSRRLAEASGVVYIGLGVTAALAEGRAHARGR